MIALLAAATALALGSAPVSIAVPDGVPIAESPNSFQCPPRSGQLIEITVGDIDCITASDFAVRYDLSGDKYQEIGPFTCYSGNAMTQPLLFTCVADSAEFAVYPA
ncbi:MAG TPA: hypothetical protein VJ777_04995 [Mycobacterium sp.]|nr:hypothetical protein [Mycobacterium sp.]